MTTRRGYKVVRKCGGSHVYAPATGRGNTLMRYRLRQCTQRDSRDSGPFAVFNNLHDAVRYLRQVPGGTILRVLYQPSSAKTLWWKPPWEKRRVLRLRYCPQGTVLADAVLPISVNPSVCRQEAAGPWGRP